jgi:5-formyltetrahydrofolate cyclo-ligase
MRSSDGEIYRLGYGGGYYDRTVSALQNTCPTLRTIGVAYTSAECVFTPQAHDRPLQTLFHA